MLCFVLVLEVRKVQESLVEKVRLSGRIKSLSQQDTLEWVEKVLGGAEMETGSVSRKKPVPEQEQRLQRAQQQLLSVLSVLLVLAELAQQ